MRYKAASTLNIADYTPAQAPDDKIGAQSSTEASLTGSFVASKTGTKYYPAGCGSIDRIRPENRIYFATEQDAKDKGYERTTACQ